MCSMDKKRITAAYVRVSLEELDKNGEYSVSIYNQLSVIREFAKRMGLVIDKEYIDDGYSGINYDRPGFEALKNDIEQGKISILITKDLSRLGREFLETIYYISEYFTKNNVRYLAINDNYDSADQNSDLREMVANIRSIINDKYVKDVSIKRKKTADLQTASGFFIGFTAPYGYKVVKKENKRTLEIDDEAATVVKRIFTSIASGKTRKEVADELNNEKILPPVIYMKMTLNKNKKYYCDWTDRIIYRILKNQTYLGNTVQRSSIKKDYKSTKRINIPVRDRTTIDHTHPPIISESLFKEANSRLKTLKRKEKNNYNGLFSGLVICGECGRVMTACRKEKNGKTVYYFQCTAVENRKRCINRTIYDTKLHDIICDAIKDKINNFVDNDEVICRAAKDLSQDKRTNGLIVSYQRNIELHNTNIHNLYMKRAAGEITLEEFLQQKNIEVELKTKEEQEMNILVSKQDDEVRKNELIEQYQEFTNNGLFTKEYIRKLIDKIVIYKDNTIQINYRFGIGKPVTIKLY